MMKRDSIMNINSLTVFNLANDDAPRPARDWLIDRWMPAGECGVLFGESCAGKTTLAFQLATAIATGHQDWLPVSEGRPRFPHHNLPASQPVVYASLGVESLEDVQIRLHRMRTEGGVEFAHLTENRLNDRLQWLDMQLLGPLWAPPETGARGTLQRAGNLVRRHCERVNAKLLVIDTLEDAFHGDDRSRFAVTPFLVDWSGWSRKLGCTVLLLSIADPKHSYWTDAPRFAWQLRPHSRGIASDAELHLAKSNYSLPGAKEDLIWKVPGAAWSHLGETPVTTVLDL